MSTPPVNISLSSSLPSTWRKPKRIFTDKDEITLLRSLLENTSNPTLEGNYTEHQIKNKINRLKQKYNNQDKPSGKKPHDLEVYEISAKIWGSKEKAEKTAVSSYYPRVMKHLKEAFPGNEDHYMEVLENLGEDLLKSFEKRWLLLEMDESEIQTKKSLLVNRHS